MTKIPADRREFRCQHCGGRILIALDLPPTRGHCPHCRQEITSPALGPMPVAPVQMAAARRVAEAPREVVPREVVPREVAPREVVPRGVASREASVREAEHATGAGSIGGQTVPEAAAVPVAAGVEPATDLRPTPVEDVAEQRRRRLGVIGALLVAALLVIGAVVLAFWLANQPGGIGAGGLRRLDPVAEREIDEARYLRIGWVADAEAVLKDFIAARTPQEKARHVIDGTRLLPEMMAFYGGGLIDDRDTPVETFSVYGLGEVDRKRGIFALTYDLPPQYELRNIFRPLAPLDVQLGVEDPDLLLSTFARVENFSSEPVRVHAFFKRTAGGMRLDWETFVQTKYRTFRRFVETPEPGRTGVFRVILLEDVPEAGVGSKGTRTYRLVDPVNLSDTARVEVPVDSETGRILAAVNWRGGGGLKPLTKTATVELGWEGGESSPLCIQRFLCWEFLGLGGTEGNALSALK